MFSPFRVVVGSAGRSLVAGRPFQTGETVLRLTGFAQRTPARTTIHVGGGDHIEHHCGRFLNHSCTPTTRIDGRRLVAVRTITEGEDITFDYMVTGTVVAPFVCAHCRELVPRRARFQYYPPRRACPRGVDEKPLTN